MVLIQMKTFTASQLSHKPAEVLTEAKANGVIIQRKNTNGDVMGELVIIDKGKYLTLKGDKYDSFS